jgi:tRNA pseudouridine55 synthase
MKCSSLVREPKTYVLIAVNKPKMISSAQVLRDLQQHFNPSELFAPWLSNERSKIARENHNQQKRRKAEKKGNKVKIGHGGTLDPLATGVLITGVGKGTKSLQDFLLCTKTYQAVVLFGTSTDSYDRVGKVLRRAPYEHITKEMVEKELNQFRGKFKQLPPLFSALKMNGKPLYEYAREGKELPRKIERRDVEVLELELVEWMEGGTHSHEPPSEEAGHAEINIANKLWSQEGALPAGESLKQEGKDDFETKKRKLNENQDDLVSERPTSKRRVATESQDATMSGGLASPSTDTTPVAEDVGKEEPEGEPSKVKGPPAAKIRMTVTSGFYVRSLCHDLGTAVGSAALMAELERTRQGDFEVGINTLEYSDLEQGEKVWGPKVAQWLDEWQMRGKTPIVSSTPVKETLETSSKQETTKQETHTEAEVIKEETIAEEGIKQASTSN